MPGKLVGSPKVGVECRAFLSILVFRPVTAVYVHHVHGLGVLNDEVCAMSVVDGFAKAGLYLLCDIEIVKDRHLAGVHLYYPSLFRGYHCHVVFYFLTNLLVVDVDVFVSGVEEISQHGHGPARLFIDELWTALCLLCLVDGALPSAGEHFHLSVELCHSLAFGDGAHDDSTILWLDALDELFQS